MVQVGQFQNLIWKNIDLGSEDGPIDMTKEQRVKHRDNVWVPKYSNPEGQDCT